ncbi:hypothetical protein MKW94_021957 [Papaver nudicaule]|uniref:Factor of DNA methylation 1-5/IDN2 domain-containing protein n=1 Tax=Papaver nudicaule TaxID=74823 RepID=A0AA41VGB6_PAPNU|nr:hypothetical protein [Papaver nudicaule]
MEAEIKRLNEANAEEMEKVQKLMNDHAAQLESSKSKNNRLVARNEILEMKDHQCSGELQEARAELINALSRLDLLGDRASVRMKNLGELDCKPFIEAAKWKFGAGKAEIKGHQLCNHWKEQLQDPNWEPFNIIQVGSNHYKAVLDEKDERLRKLKSDMGDAVVHAVQTVMMETAEFGATVDNVIPELWNFKENRKATLKEGIQKLSKEVKYVNL